MKVKSLYNLVIKSKENVTICQFEKGRIYDAIWKGPDILIKIDTLRFLRFTDIDVFNENFEILGNA